MCSAYDSGHNAVVVPCCGDDECAILKSAKEKRIADSRFRADISDKLSHVPSPEGRFWEVRMLPPSRSLFLNKTDVYVDLNVKRERWSDSGRALLCLVGKGQVGKE